MKEVCYHGIHKKHPKMLFQLLLEARGRTYIYTSVNYVI